jgi:hypothetical protein
MKKCSIFLWIFLVLKKVTFGSTRNYVQLNTFELDETFCSWLNSFFA